MSSLQVFCRPSQVRNLTFPWNCDSSVAQHKGHFPRICAQSVTGSLLQWSNTLISTPTPLVQIRSHWCRLDHHWIRLLQIRIMLSDSLNQQKKIDLKNISWGSLISQLFRLFIQMWTNSYLIDRPNQSIKLSDLEWSLCLFMFQSFLRKWPLEK